MTRRQTPWPTQWLILQRPPDAAMWRRLRTLPRGSGVLMLAELTPTDGRRLRQVANLRELALASERDGSAARVHDVRELRRALLRRVPLILLSPIFPTSTHPHWRALPRMRAANLARLGNRRLIALGGMDRRRFGRIRQLGFAGWAGISAWSRS
jgi:thiamine-phosphate pyrophosphorylase